MELKEVISQQDMQWFGPRDFYIPPQRFTSTVFMLDPDDMVFPEEVWGVGEEEQTDEEGVSHGVYASLEALMGHRLQSPI